jgi:hypothetical protein
MHEINNASRLSITHHEVDDNDEDRIWNDSHRNDVAEDFRQEIRRTTIISARAFVSVGQS